MRLIGRFDRFALAFEFSFFKLCISFLTAAEKISSIFKHRTLGPVYFSSCHVAQHEGVV